MNWLTILGGLKSILGKVPWYIYAMLIIGAGSYFEGVHLTNSKWENQIKDNPVKSDTTNDRPIFKPQMVINDSAAAIFHHDLNQIDHAESLHFIARDSKLLEADNLPLLRFRIDSLQSEIDQRDQLIAALSDTAYMPPFEDSLGTKLEVHYVPPVHEFYFSYQGPDLEILQQHIRERQTLIEPASSLWYGIKVIHTEYETSIFAGNLGFKNLYIGWGIFIDSKPQYEIGWKSSISMPF